MRILLDECLPGRKLKRAFTSHEVKTVAEMNWRGVTNGELLAQAESGFDAFITVDARLQYQQNVPSFDLLIIVLRARSNRLEDLLPLIAAADGALRTGHSGQVIEVSA